MRISHKLLLVAVTALAAMAFGASSASAQVSVAEEPTGIPCDPTCQLHIVGATTLVAHIPMLGEVTASACQDEFIADLTAGGTGGITATLSGPSCTQQPCEEPWEVHGLTEVAPDTVDAHVEFCLAGSDGEHKNCEIDVRITEVPGGSHNYALTSVGQSCINHQGIEVEVNGNWTTEGTNAELVHS